MPDQSTTISPAPAIELEPRECRPADHAWALAFEYAQETGLEDARAFADDYAAFLEDYNSEIHDPDLPAPTPSEYIR